MENIIVHLMNSFPKLLVLRMQCVCVYRNCISYCKCQSKKYKSLTRYVKSKQ